MRSRLSLAGYRRRPALQPSVALVSDADRPEGIVRFTQWQGPAGATVESQRARLYPTCP